MVEPSAHTSTGRVDERTDWTGLDGPDGPGRVRTGPDGSGRVDAGGRAGRPRRTNQDGQTTLLHTTYNPPTHPTTYPPHQHLTPTT